MPGSKRLGEECVVYKRPQVGVMLPPNNTYHVRDLRGRHVTSIPRGAGQYTKRFWPTGAVYYNRVDWSGSRRSRSASMGMIKNKIESCVETKYQEIALAPTTVALRTHTQKMNAIMTHLFGHALTATQYAQQVGMDRCDRVAFNWCHLIAHGLGGADEGYNLVAASTHNNSEQLVIENALYAYRNETNFFNVKVTAGLKGSAPTLAYAGLVIRYRIEDTAGTEIYQTLLDCSKDTAPTAFLEGEIFADVCTRLNYWLHRNHGVSELEARAVLDDIDNDASFQLV
jgi:hypothetical protein